jgi:hypothetical protein
MSQACLLNYHLLTLTTRFIIHVCCVCISVIYTVLYYRFGSFFWQHMCIHMTKNRWWNCVQTDINKCKITNWKERSKNRDEWEKYMKTVKICTGL